MSPRLLLVEDDDAIAEVMRDHLAQAGFELRRAADGAQAMRAIDEGGFELALLDLTLPGVDGWDLCRRLRGRDDHVPLIIVSARSAEAHRVLGLELGADDYLAKPFSMLELVARVRALLRRVQLLRERPMAPEVPRLGGLWLDVQRRELRHGDEAHPLTLREYDLLRFLIDHPGRAFTRTELLDRVWGQGFDGYEHTVNSHINRLRAKLAVDAAAAGLIETVWGTGYRFAGPAR